MYCTVVVLNGAGLRRPLYLIYHSYARIRWRHSILSIKEFIFSYTRSFTC